VPDPNNRLPGIPRIQWDDEIQLTSTSAVSPKDLDRAMFDLNRAIGMVRKYTSADLGPQIRLIRTRKVKGEPAALPRLRVRWTAHALNFGPRLHKKDPRFSAIGVEDVAREP